MVMDMTIGQLASETGTSPETIRYYERSGYLPTPHRRTSGYRVYQRETVNRLRFIKEAKKLGFTLNEVRELFALTDDPDTNCATVNQKARHKITEIEAKITTLQQMKKNLKVLATICPDDEQPLSECSIINHLYEHTED
ncbi:heavy metal-responsive transcriptional regulator [Paremcibacter congregatus]|uniref:Heavy metal-responsive transcriptional regulator n=3 Tax=Paremcibacter congregatus TaxID=2043170 RepID=A0A2G4YSV6_9PROT|nr:heavy metal-responsive transcriptional regulator [Paremcibacter congregatus]QDE29265.1 heavy metal-responsive transcriptional regulator [Paremcibacter congregatus]